MLIHALPSADSGAFYDFAYIVGGGDSPLAYLMVECRLAHLAVALAQRAESRSHHLSARKAITGLNAPLRHHRPSQLGKGAGRCLDRLVGANLSVHVKFERISPSDWRKRQLKKPCPERLPGLDRLRVPPSECSTAGEPDAGSGGEPRGEDLPVGEPSQR